MPAKHVARQAMNQNPEELNDVRAILYATLLHLKLDKLDIPLAELQAIGDGRFVGYRITATHIHLRLMTEQQVKEEMGENGK